MADALISPAVGGTMWAVTTGLIGYCSARVDKRSDDHTIPLMGVMGAFVFAAQMINFAIPGTGSSGHIGGGLLLAVLLGPHAAFLTLASVLTIQALFFADGGILALGCNIFNLGFFPCLIAYPLIYKPLAGVSPNRTRIFTAALVASVAGLQMGSLGVVLQTTLSGITDLPLTVFLMFMQPIHLAIGTVEGLATAFVVLFVLRNRPEILYYRVSNGKPGFTKVLLTLLLAALITAGGFSWFTSQNPDGLEWSIFQTAGAEVPLQQQSSLHRSSSRLQEKTTLLPEYGFRGNTTAGQEQPPFPASVSGHLGTSAAGLLGSVLTLLIASAVGLLLKLRRSPT